MAGITPRITLDDTPGHICRVDEVDGIAAKRSLPREHGIALVDHAASPMPAGGRVLIGTRFVRETMQRSCARDRAEH
jgi:hypothetical protein